MESVRSCDPDFMTPEEKARQQIDAQLTTAGWIVQDYKAFNPSAGPDLHRTGIGSLCRCPVANPHRASDVQGRAFY